MAREEADPRSCMAVSQTICGEELFTNIYT